MESLQVAVMKKSQDQSAQMALQLVQDVVQSNQQINANAMGANPSDRLGQNINISV
jgi:hypothetical protein